jgi:hypothetical protein
MAATQFAILGVLLCLNSTVSVLVPVVLAMSAIRSYVTSAWEQASRDCHEVMWSSSGVKLRAA